jgi:hypothetical protein
MFAFDNLIVSVHRSAAGTAWRWRTELTTLALLGAFYGWLSSQLESPAWAGAVLAGFVGILLGLPWSRRFLTSRFWCLLTRHRFQRLCWEARLHTRAGRLPAVLWIRPTRVGERLWVWCRAGISAEDFTDHTDELRAACYARDARVTRNPRWSQLVTIDIIRRDTLAATNKVATPLARLTTIYAAQPGDVTPISGPASGDDAPGWPDGPGLDTPAA